MALLSRIKATIKRRPMGLYYAERFKKYLYEKRLQSYDDRHFIEWWYAKKNNGLVPDLNNPQTFTEKLQWMKLYYRDERMTRCSDKYELKNYLAEQGLAELAIPTLALYDGVGDIDVQALPATFVLKATHGCGWQWICRGDKNDIDWKWAKKNHGGLACGKLVHLRPRVELPPSNTAYDA